MFFCAIIAVPNFGYRGYSLLLIALYHFREEIFCFDKKYAVFMRLVAFQKCLENDKLERGKIVCK